MTHKRITQFNQQRKREASQESGILQRAAVRWVSEAKVQSTEDKEAQPLGNSALSKNFSRVPISTTKPQQIMTKLMIGQVGDKYEQEADRVAAQVVQRINAPVSVQSGEDETVQREEMETQDNEARLMRSPILQCRSSDGGMAATPDLESSINRARGGGQPLTNNARKPMEQAFGADFSKVKVHTDAQANQLSQSIQARAFTTGQDVFFRQGEYNLSSRGGQELIAHELTHVVQQGGSRIQRQQSSQSINNTNHQQELIQREQAPEFEKHYKDTSIGIESELGGFFCALPQNATRTFAFVKTTQTNEALVQVTKDMSRGAYIPSVNEENAQAKVNWMTHTVELVTYPSLKKDEIAVKNRNDAMLFLIDLFKQRLVTNNKKALEGVKSEDGRFTLVITNVNHLIATANSGADDNAPSVTMSRANQQATMGVKAKDFGSGSSPELEMLEAAPWYKKDFKQSFVKDLNGELEDLTEDQKKEINVEQMKNVYAYLRSIFTFTAELASQYNIPIGDWVPQGTQRAEGLTAPQVKNAWKILPRTKPKLMLDVLSKSEKTLVLKELRESINEINVNANLSKAVFQYFINQDGEVAGHSINNAKIDEEAAALFEFRAIPSKLEDFVPKEASVPLLIEDLLSVFGQDHRKTAVQAINNFVIEKSDEFKDWYNLTFNKQLNNPALSAVANVKARWIQTKYQNKWKEILRSTVG